MKARYCFLFKRKSECVEHLRKKLYIRNFTKIHPLGVVLFRADRRMDGYDRASSRSSLCGSVQKLVLNTNRLWTLTRIAI